MNAHSAARGWAGLHLDSLSFDSFFFLGKPTQDWVDESILSKDIKSSIIENAIAGVLRLAGIITELSNIGKGTISFNSRWGWHV